MARVLVVDDDPDIRDLVSIKLELMGHEVHGAADGRAGLVACRELCPDLAIVDVNMPVMTGLELVVALRASEEHRDLPVVMLTALSQEADRRAGLAAGATDYVAKPFSPAALACRVTELLAG